MKHDPARRSAQTSAETLSRSRAEMTRAPLIGNVLSEVEAMALAIQLAEDAAHAQEVPVGAVIVDQFNRVRAARGNEVEGRRDASAHAEILAMRDAALELNSKYLAECTLFVTLEPCPMCAAAMVHFKLRRLVFGAYDPKGGGVEHGVRVFDQSQCLSRPEVVGGVRATECGALLKHFFQARR